MCQYLLLHNYVVEIISFIIFVDILDSVPQGSVLSRELKADIWSYDLLHVICMTLKQKHLDFPHSITGGWRTVQTLVEILR